MVLYNITFNVESAAQTAWLAYLERTFLPAVRTPASPQPPAVYEVTGVYVSDGVTYSVQLFFDTAAAATHFEAQRWPDLQASMEAAFPGQYVHFRSLLHRVELDQDQR